MSYTADPRVLFAAERTLLAWQRSAIALMGFGFVVERFGLFLQMVAHQSESGAQRSFSLGVGVLLLVLGAAVALISARQFRQVAKNLDPLVVPPGYWTQIGVLLNVLIAIIALVFAWHFVSAARSGGSDGNNAAPQRAVRWALGQPAPGCAVKWA
jgi:putative membrane protein